MNRIILVIVGLFSGFVGVSQEGVKRPKLVVGIVVDQMREEYLYRFYDHYSEGGFKRLMNDGFEVKNAHFNYIPTKTAPGHASVYTGTTPRVHGIIANDWYDKEEKRYRYCVEDETMTQVGGSAETGKISPVNLQTTTVTDELALFYQERAKIIGMSIKDRGAVLPAGHQPDAAYWYDTQTGEFMTSSYYKEALPKWVKKFNKQGLADSYMQGAWETFFPIEKYVESGDDNRAGERPFAGKNEATFPYDLKAYSKPRSLIKSTPWGNTILAEFAKASLESEGLGQDEVTDFLAVSFSSTDYVGHTFGPYSKEVEDTYVRLDRDLESLFQALDEKVGKGQWTVFLTADHAVAPIPEAMKEKHMPADYWGERSAREVLNAKLNEAFGIDSLIESVSNEQLFLNHDLIGESSLTVSDVKAYLISLLKKTDGINAVYDGDDISNYSGNNYDVSMLAAGYNQHRSGDILLIINSGWIDGDPNGENTGTTHGSHYSYDTHVPMLFYGWGVHKGKTYDYHPITDIAPTISMLLNIGLPSGATGQPIVEVFE
ncbi:Predicted pyrophosphatase or phosphodiesterase, AlkP superfamily [Reichenbachiella agariperforans]|uniref:Predicted pyrophosphatase or phosphodiesterase, AlkP superfamily n=1 Tax=Reichenbachiella agariperforans TaxID=156994 RepID=A0A1M6K9G8_REIAG|nr:alkaline phosphatase PafA [Reichenbachiella agariperforans]SHJ55585.1 Predicted pyrophosphatase or phosphodiesterase, AlkP superfamily [Reichenbachiella agariperforans]